MGGSMGAKPPWRGVGGVPQSFKIGGELLPFAIPPRVGPKALANLKPTREGKWGGPWGRSPHGGGLGGVPQSFKIGGELLPFATPPRVGPKTLANTKLTRVGKMVVQGAKPLGKGFGGSAPTKPKMEKKAVQLRGEL